MPPMSHIPPRPERGAGRGRRGILALVLLAASCGREPPGSASDALSRAEELASRGREIEAARAVGAALASLPPSRRGAARLAMSRYYHRGGAFGPALAEAEEALRAGETGTEALYLKGDAERRLERLDEAQATLKRVLDLEPAHRLAQLSLASILFRASDPAAALPLFESYFRSASPGDPVYEEALLEHGRALRAAGRHQEAVDRFMLLLLRDPLRHTLYSELAASLYRLRLRREARFVEDIYKVISENAFEEHVEEGLERSGAAAYALAQRAANRIRQRRFLAAFQSYRQAVEIDSGSPLIRIHLADLCLRFHRHREAGAVLDAALAAGLRPASGLHWAAARLAIEEGRHPAALLSAKRGREALLDEGDQGGVERGQALAFSLFLIRARAALTAGDLLEAEKAALEAGRQSPGSWEPLYWLGKVELERGAVEKAVALLGQAAERGGRSLPDLVCSSAAALQRTGRADQARESLRALIQSSPGCLPAYAALLDLLSEGREKSPVLEAQRKARGLVDEVAAREREVDARPLQDSGETYLALARLRLELREPAAFDCLFLAGDLLPRNTEVLRLLLSGMKAPQDLFVRLQALHRLSELEPEDPAVLRELVEHHLRLHVLLGEARALAERLHALGPSPQSFELLARATLLLGEQERGAEILREAVAAYPEVPSLREALSRAAGSGK